MRPEGGLEGERTCCSADNGVTGMFRAKFSAPDKFRPRPCSRLIRVDALASVQANERVRGRANEQANERAREQASESKREQTSEQTKERERGDSQARSNR